MLAVVGPLVLDPLGIDSLTVGTPDMFTFLFAFSSSPTEISMSVGPAVFGIGALVGLAYAFIQSYRHARSREGETEIMT